MSSKPDPVEARTTKRRTVRIGHRQFITHGLGQNFLTDLYHHSMTISWGLFWFVCAGLFIVINSVFAVLYMLMPGSIAHARPGHFSDVLFYSIETLSTVGYGDMFPAGVYGRTLSTIEIFFGMTFMAIMIGLVFARFSRPEALIVFARHPVIGTYNGKRTLMLRMANARHNDITDAHAKLWLVKLTRTQEGAQSRHFHQLTLIHEENPGFTLSWTLYHLIDEKSPFWQETKESLKKQDASLIISLNGFDENAAQDIHRRKIYPSTDIRWDHQYAMITKEDEGGHMHIDYNKFHDIVPLNDEKEPG